LDRSQHGKLNRKVFIHRDFDGIAITNRIS
jgi:hypothetical protein